MSARPISQQTGNGLPAYRRHGTFTGTTLPSSNLDDGLDSLSRLRVHGGGPMNHGFAGASR